MSSPVAVYRLLAAGIALLAMTACSASTTTTPPPAGTSVATVAVSPATASLMTAQTVQLTATPRDAAGNGLSGLAITWAASPTAVATVNASGLVTAVSAGTVTVTATTGGKSGSATITVAVTDVATIGPAGGTMNAASGNVTLTFPAGALATATQISVTPITNPVTSGLLYSGTAYELGPTGTQFAVPVTLSIPYASLPTGVDPTLLRLYTLSGTTWQRAPTTWADTVAHTVSASIDHFSGWIACEYPCYATQPAIEADIYLGDSWQMSAGTTVHLGGMIYERNTSVTVTPSLAGLPTGMSGSTGPGSGDGQDFAITLTANSTMPGGLYPISIRASAPGFTDVVSVFHMQVIGHAYTFSASPVTLNVAQGATGTSALTFTRVGGFSGALALTAENLPTGVTASFAPASVSGTSSTVTFTVGASAQLGDAMITLRAKTPGLADATVSFDLFVNPSNASGFTVAGTPPSVNVAPGGSASTGVQATRTGGFSGAIAYAVVGLPTGLTASVAPTSVADSVTLFVTAAASLTLGSYPITVTATSGSTVRQATISVGVAAQGHIDIHLDYSACAASAQPIWVAFQDGASAFTRVTGSGNTYTFTLTSAKGALAVVTSGTNGFKTAVTYGTQAELAAFSGAGAMANCSTVAGKTINASILGATQTVGLGMGGAMTTVAYPGDQGKGVLSNVAFGPQDVTAIMFGPSPKMIFRRDLDIANAGSLAPFDFGGSEVFTPASAQIIGVTPGYEFFEYSNGAPGCQFTPIYSGGFGPTIYGIPASLQRPADMHMLVVLTAGGGTAVSYFHTMADQVLTVGASLPSSAVSLVNGSPYKQLSASATFADDYQSLWLSYQAGTLIQPGNTFTVAATTAYSGGSTVSVVAPNLAGVSGYQVSWAPVGTVNYTLVASSLNSVSLSPVCSDGFKYKSAQLNGTM